MGSFRRMMQALCVGIIMMVLLSACGSRVSQSESQGGGAGTATGTENAAAGGGGFIPSAAEYCVYDESAATGQNGAAIDVSSASKGYVGVTVQSDSRIKFQVVHGEDVLNYDMPTDGTPAFFTLSYGDGTYKLRVMQNTTEDKYAEICSTQIDVTMDSEYEPFLHNSQIVNYSADSQCVELASQIASESSDEIDFISRVYNYVTENISYDYDEAGTVEYGYLPNPDEVLATGKGICYDYSSLSAAMLRSQGIPCKLITGWVSPENVYHAWNQVYTDKTGWITVEIQLEEGQWKLVDTTFGASDDGNADQREYTQTYVY